MLEKLQALDRALMLELNSYHSPAFDQAMYWVSHKFFWVPFYLLLVYFIIRQYGWNAFYVLAGIGLVIAFSDRFTSGFMKPFFERPRPCHDPLIGYLIHTYDKCGGRYGFASSHAANVFGLATFLWLLLRRTYRFIGLLFLWAILVSYSRVYLGVHYPGDITVGALVGIICAFIIYWLYRVLSPSLADLNKKRHSQAGGSSIKKQA